MKRKISNTIIISKEEKTSAPTQLLLINQNFFGENQVTRRCCSRSRPFCVVVDIPVNYYWAIIILSRKPLTTNQHRWAS